MLNRVVTAIVNRNEYADRKETRIENSNKSHHFGTLLTRQERDRQLSDGTECNDKWTVLRNYLSLIVVDQNRSVEEKQKETY